MSEDEMPRSRRPGSAAPTKLDRAPGASDQRPWEYLPRFWRRGTNGPPVPRQFSPLNAGDPAIQKLAKRATAKSGENKPNGPRRSAVCVQVHKKKEPGRRVADGLRGCADQVRRLLLSTGVLTAALLRADGIPSRVVVACSTSMSSWGEWDLGYTCGRRPCLEVDGQKKWVTDATLRGNTPFDAGPPSPGPFEPRRRKPVRPRWSGWRRWLGRVKVGVESVI